MIKMVMVIGYARNYDDRDGYAEIEVGADTLFQSGCKSDERPKKLIWQI